MAVNISTDRFQRAFALLSVHEGGYVNHPKDPGGATNKGVTQRTYDAYRERIGQSPRDVRQITDAEVETIYRNQYWNAVRADDLPRGVAYCVFDAAVNSGPGQAVKWLQRVIGVKVDGVVGDETIGMARAMSAHKLIHAYCDMRLAFMKRLKHWSTFKNGWRRRVHEVRAQSIEWASNDVVATQTAESPQPKAEGKESMSATMSDIVRDPRALSAVGGVMGSAGSLASGDGPVQYAFAAVLMVGALVGIWWLVRGKQGAHNAVGD